MNITKALEYFKTHYPGKNILQLPEEDPAEIICETDPSSLHPGFSTAITAIRKSQPHFHKVMVETYTVNKGQLKLTVDGKKLTLNEGDEYTIQPNQVHSAEGDFTIVLVESKPGWTPDDHFLV